MMKRSLYAYKLRRWPMWLRCLVILATLFVLVQLLYMYSIQQMDVTLVKEKSLYNSALKKEKAYKAALSNSGKNGLFRKNEMSYLQVATAVKHVVSQLKTVRLISLTNMAHEKIKGFSDDDLKGLPNEVKALKEKQLYENRVKVVLEGRYFPIMILLARLDKEYPGLCWKELKYKVLESGEGRVTITLFGVST